MNDDALTMGVDGQANEVTKTRIAQITVLTTPK